MKKIYILLAILLLVGCFTQPKTADEIELPTPPANPTPAKEAGPAVEAPKGTVPYSADLCKTKKDQQAFSFVNKKDKPNSKGCVRPVKSWVYNEKKDRWDPTSAKAVWCCDPFAPGAQPQTQE